MTNRFRAAATAAAVVLGATALAATSGAPAQAATARYSPGFARDVASLEPTAPYVGFVHFRSGTARDFKALVNRHGLTVTKDYSAVNAVLARGTLADFRSLDREANVNYLESVEVLEYHGDTSRWATRVGVVQSPAGGGPYRSPSGAVLDGTGVGVAVVDSGADDSHPDLVNQIARNFQVVCATPFLVNTQTDTCFQPVVRELPNGVSSDTSSGHGTHVTGIVGGDGTASHGTFTGVAPGATLYTFGAGAALSAAFAEDALYYILTNYNSFSPAIKVVNNSYGGQGDPYDPDSIISKTVNALVTQKGVTVTWSASNAGGDGSEDLTAGWCKNPTPGVICVANYNDNDSGDRNFALDESSSRGKKGDKLTYPDVSAPGANIVSTCQVSNALCNAAGFLTPALAWEPYYRAAYGTSMSAPHVAGVVALLLQADPTLTPAEVEDILLDTAHKFGDGYESDPQNSNGTTSFDKGAGLVDVPAALRDSRIGVTGDNATSPTALATGDAGDFSAVGAADLSSISVAASATGLTYSLTVANASDVGPTGLVAHVIRSNVNGLARETTVLLRSSGASPDASEATDNDPVTAPASSASRSGNTITVVVPYSALGSPPAGSPVHNVWVASYVGLIVDAMPSPATPSVGADGIIRPLHAPAFTTG